MSAGTSGGKVAVPQPTPKSSTTVTAATTKTVPRSPVLPAPDQIAATPAKVKAPSVHSDGGGHKFTLKDLLASGPKVARKSSQRSVGSSKKSDSDGGGGKSVGGDSAASLTQKYGVCQKMAIGKGATSVVRLAHKWDRSEEKLYAVKVCFMWTVGSYY
jgi:protein-serine/threonine kinase